MSGAAVAAVLRRDLRLALSYRLNFLLTAGSSLFSAVLWFYLSAFVTVRGTEVPGGYFAFVMTGTVLLHYATAALHGVSRRLGEEQAAGTLEFLLSSPAPLWGLLLASVLLDLLLRTADALLLLGAGAALGLEFHLRHPLALLVIAGLSVASFAALGILAGSFLLVFQRGEPVTPLVGGLLALLGGVFFPPSVLPPFLAAAARLLPLSYAADGLRAVLLEGKGLADLGGVLLPLAFFAALLLPLSFLAFASALRAARRYGLLGRY